MADPTVVALPLTLTFPNMALTFVADATIGVRLASLDHTTGGSFVWTLDAEVGLERSPAGDGSLWHAEARRWDEETNGLPVSSLSAVPTMIGPRHAKQFIVYDYSAVLGYEEAYCFQWTGCTIPGSEDVDSIWVQLFVERRDALDERCHFRLNFGRERGGGYTIDAISCPALHVLTPTGDARRVRVLAHNSLNIASPAFLGHNVPLMAFTAIPEIRNDYPSPFAQLPFVTIAAMDSGHLASFRRCLHIQSEDVAGNHHRWYRVGGEDTGSEVLDLHHQYIPSYSRDLSADSDDDGVTHEAFSRAESVGSYSVSLTAFTAATDAFWYDAAAFYRDTIIPLLAPPTRASNARLGDLAKESTVFIATQIDDAYYILDNNAATDLLISFITEVCDALRGLTFPVTIQLELQAPLRFGGRARIPHEGDIDGPGWSSEIWGAGTMTLAERLDRMLAQKKRDDASYEVIRRIDTGVYTRPGDLPSYIPRNDHGFASLRVSRAPKTPMGGQQQVITPAAQVASSVTERLDIADPGTQEYLIREYLQSALNFGMRGIYLDTFGGVYTTYPRRAYFPAGRFHPAHGGTYSTDAVRTIGQRIRDELQPRWVVNELFSESGLGLVDAAQPDYSYSEGMMTLGEGFSPFADVMPSVSHPTQCRDSTPPLVQAVWNRHHASLRLQFAPIDLSLSTSSVHPGPGAEPGLSTDQYLDVLCYTHGLSLVAGQSITCLEFFMDRLTVILDPHDAGVGTAAWNFIRDRLTWVRNVARFLISGTLQRPLVHDPDAQASLQQNPVYTARTLVNPAVTIPDVPPRPPFTKFIGVPFFVGPGDARTLPYDAPQVAHSVWHDPASDDLLILLVNWSANPIATFDATYLEAVWGKAAATASQLHLDGSVTPLGVTTPTTTVSANGAAALNVALPARSVAAILLE